MPKLYVLIGVPGSGKSTWVKNQDWAKDCAYISTDMHVENQAKLEGKTYNEVFKDFMPTAVKMMTDDVIKAREASKDIIWDQTSTSIKSRAKKFNMLRDYHAIAVVFRTPPKEELARRLANRPGKNIPDHVMRSMIDNWEEPTEDEGFKEIWFAPY
jgi:predicted kinase